MSPGPMARWRWLLVANAGVILAILTFVLYRKRARKKISEAQPP
jgi:hypothetical protein